MTTATIFGTDGIRGPVGKDYLTSKKLLQLGAGIARWALTRCNTRPTILLAHDPRCSTSWVKATLKSGLLAHPVTVYDAGMLPTPAAFQIIEKNNLFNMAVIVSASHNHYQDNGIKIIDAAHGKLTTALEQELSALCTQEHTIDYRNLGQEHLWESAHHAYRDTILSHFSSAFLRNKKIVLDCANGATSVIAPALFTRLGADIVAINNRPNGTNINKKCGTLFPEQLKQTVLDTGADAGVAFDGDGDRVMIVTRTGQLKDGDDILALLSTHPRYADTTTIVGTVMTNQGFETFLKRKGKSLVRTPVGDKYVIQKLTDEHLSLGGEQSGHIIMSDYLNAGDGIFAALRVLETVYLTDNWDMETFAKYPQVIINVPVTTRKDLATPALARLIQDYQNKLTTGRLLVRYSGTEPVLRVMIENQDEQIAQTIGSRLSQELKKELS